jgi:hypothetical protein
MLPLWIGWNTTYFLSLSLLILIRVCFFTSLIRMFLTLLANVFVASLALEMFFKLISHLLNLLWGAWFHSLLLSSGSGIGRLGHLSFNLLCRLSGLGLLRGLLLLKFESDLVYAPCRNGKMIAASHFLVNTVMTEQPRQLLHMDTVGPSQVCSMEGKWYVLVIVDDYSRYSWVFFLESKDEVVEHFRSLALRLNNE